MTSSVARAEPVPPKGTGEYRGLRLIRHSDLLPYQCGCYANRGLHKHQAQRQSVDNLWINSYGQNLATSGCLPCIGHPPCRRPTFCVSRETFTVGYRWGKDSPSRWCPLRNSGFPGRAAHEKHQLNSLGRRGYPGCGPVFHILTAGQGLGIGTGQDVSNHSRVVDNAVNNRCKEFVEGPSAEDCRLSGSRKKRAAP